MSSPVPEPDPIPEVLTIDRPEQLKALGHPLRLRVLEALGETDAPMSNRELAQKLGVDPGHLHFHVRMLLKAGLIQQVASAKGREKPYRSAAKTLKVPPGQRLQHEHRVGDGDLLQVLVPLLERLEDALDGVRVAEDVLGGERGERVRDVAGEVVTLADR